MEITAMICLTVVALAIINAIAKNNEKKGDK